MGAGSQGLAVATFVLGVAAVVSNLTRDVLITAIAVLLAYPIFACRPSRAALTQLLRDMQGRD